MFKLLKKRLSETKKKIIKKVTEKNLKQSDFDEVFEDLELSLLQANVAVNTINTLKKELSKELVNKDIKKKLVTSTINKALTKAISELLTEGNVNELIKNIKSSIEPVSIMFVGSNGSGKTTTIAKLANYFKKKGITTVLAACDTFRAASIEQLETHGKALGFKVIKHSYGSDAAAVAYDAIEHAKAKGLKVVLIDTAGRSHSNVNLMRELEKVKNVVKPEYVIFVGDALTGNDVVLQCRDFSKATSFDYAILTKTDVDEKGGAIISVSHETGVPILFLGTGQGYNDLKSFNKNELIKQLT